MSFFEVPGWTVPPAPLSQTSKKRKRPAAKDADGEDHSEAHRMQAAQKNIEKLMQALGAGKQDGVEGEDIGRSKNKRKGDGKKRKLAVDDATPKDHQTQRSAKRGGNAHGPQRNNTKKKSAGDVGSADSTSRSQEGSAKGLKSKQKKKQTQKNGKSMDGRFDAVSTQGDASNSPVAKADDTLVTMKKAPGKRKDEDVQQGLTAMQANMKKSLDGARFRWINETLYKSDSAKAYTLMREDPAIFADYHTGFRHQVTSWPTNPVSHYISALSSYPAKTVVADLGCGDAALARALVPKGMVVLSFDLVSDGAYVVGADACAHVPLPGSEDQSGDGNEVDEGQIVDVVVCALSLMGTNWPGCIREAWRILRTGGELQIAEVTSRFADVDVFTSFISSFGFKLNDKDERNTHFTLFEFEKVPRKPKGEKDWKKMLSQGQILNPCEYKRR